MTITKLSDANIKGEISRTNVIAYGDGKRYNSVRMEGRVSMPALLDFLDEHALNVDENDIYINFGSVTWIDDATPDEIAQLAARKAAGQAKLEEYERQKLAELLLKYGPESTINTLRKML